MLFFPTFSWFLFFSCRYLNIPVPWNLWGLSKPQEPIDWSIFLMSQPVLTCDPRHTFTLGLSQWPREGGNYSEVFMLLSQVLGHGMMKLPGILEGWYGHFDKSPHWNKQHIYCLDDELGGGFKDFVCLFLKKILKTYAQPPNESLKLGYFKWLQGLSHL